MLTVRPDPKNRRVLLSLKQSDSKILTGVNRGLRTLGSKLRNESREDIRKKPKSGKTYIVYKDGRRSPHVASAPGEAPANLTGALARSVNFVIKGKELEFGANTPYAPALELGSKKRNLAARPYLISVIKKNQENARSIIMQAINRELIGN